MLASTYTRILSLDPGTQNYGYAVLEFDSARNVRVLQSGRIFDTIRALNKDLVTQVKAYSDTLHALIESFDVSLVIAERYMSRRMGGSTIECVNCMLGVLMEVCVNRGIRLRVIPASQWKNEASRYDPVLLENAYHEGKVGRITPHTVDAVMIGLYGRYLALGAPPFQNLRPSSLIKAIQHKGLTDIGQPVKKATKKRRKRRG